MSVTQVRLVPDVEVGALPAASNAGLYMVVYSVVAVGAEYATAALVWVKVTSSTYTEFPVVVVQFMTPIRT